MRTWRSIAGLALWRDTAGAAMVEFTLLAPFLLFLGLGVSEFGRFLYQYQLVLDGLRDGARYLARAYDPGDTTDEATAKETKAINLAVTGTIDGTGTARVDDWAAADVTFNVTPVDNSDGSYRGGAFVYTVQASTTFDYVDVGFLDALGLPALSITATHMQRAIGE
ncbi:TadE/TadG family type IV pilus assembly protein [Dongia deserti]|uniref:TadE/TadG family type IV pilus assembly protein n=1 Tax=Dongia deserti TaxID=2268030 RepID=UPI000E647D15|nr:TadE/TadG family type IV pilus assembly protein [Dongia deserti]